MLKKVIALKNLLLLCFIVLASSIGMRAQTVSGGLKAGLNVSGQEISGSGLGDSNPRLGFHFGMFFNFKFSEKIGLQPELIFSAQGSKMGDSLVYKFSYFNIPVLFRYNITKIISIHAGPQLGFLTRAQVERYGSVIKTNPTFRSYFEDIDFGLAAGLGIDLPNGFGLGARYIQGMMEIQKSNSDVTFKNHNLQFYISYRMTGSDK